MKCRIVLTLDTYNKGSDDHQDSLNEIGPNDGRQTSGDGEYRRNDEEYQDGNVNGLGVSLSLSSLSDE